MAIERIVPGTIEWDAYYANHISRYQFAAEQLKHKNIKIILDAACGVGYGSNYLANQISDTQVIAVDRSVEALGVAHKNFKKDNIRFLEDDCQTLENAATFGLFDAIVSFETLEHLPKPDDFLERCKRNLKTDGLLIVSTPNQPVTSPDGLQWEYHEKEYTVEEFVALLTKHGFSNIEIYGQKFTAIGKLRQEIHRELNRIHSNPFYRLGALVQKLVRKVKFPAVLPEQPEDIEIVHYPNYKDVNTDIGYAPFVLIAVCKK